MTEHNGYSIERLNAEKCKDLAILHKAVYDRMPAQDYFRKKYDTGFSGRMHIGFIAYDALKKPVAFYGVLPCFLEIDGKQVPAAQSADTMTHPHHRNKGLFVLLAEKCYERCRKEGIEILFGFPNQHSLHGFVNKLGWQRIGTMQCFVIPVKGIAFSKLVYKFSILKWIYQWYGGQILKKYQINKEGLGNGLITEGFDGLCRNDAFLHYRNYSDTQVICIDDSLVWLKIQQQMVIGDMRTTEEQFENAMHQLQKIAALMGMTGIMFHISEGTELCRLFSNRYEVMESFPVIVKQLSGNHKMDKLKFVFADIDIF